MLRAPVPVPVIDDTSSLILSRVFIGMDIGYELLVAFGLLLVLEGILPFLNPPSARKAFLLLAQLDDATLRFGGLTCMLLGVILLYWVN